MSADVPFDRTILRGTGEAELIARAEALSPDDEVDEYWAIVHELQRRGTRAAFDWACGLIEDDEEDRRRLGCDVLAQLGYEDGHPFRERSVALLERRCGDPSTTVLAAAISALGHAANGSDGVHRAALDTVIALAAHEEANVRYAVASALPSLVGLDWVEAGEPAVVALLSLCADPAPDVRSWATFGVGARLKVDGPSVRDCLRARLTDSDADTAGEALAGLARRHDREALAAVRAALGAEQVSRLTIEAAGWLADPSLHQILTRLANWWDVDAELLGTAVRRCDPGFVAGVAATVGALVSAAEQVELDIIVSSELLGQRPEGPMVQLAPTDHRGYGLEPLMRRAGGSASVAADLIRSDAVEARRTAL